VDVTCSTHILMAESSFYDEVRAESRGAIRG